MPRGHFKSTIMHGFSVWAILSLPYYVTTVLYLSNKDDSTKKHVEELKKAVFRNPKLKFLHSLIKEDTLEFEIKLPDGRSKVLDYKSVFQIYRGYHFTGVLIMDDIYADPTDPDSPSQILKINKRYESTIKSIPTRRQSCQILVGTPISNQDLLAKLPKRSSWNEEFYEVYSKEPGTTDETLAPHLMNKKEATELESDDWISFQSEYRCRPYYDSQSFLTSTDIQNLTNKSLSEEGWDINTPYPKSAGELVVAGVDLGRMRDPTHISIFSAKGKFIRQIFCMYLEQTPYPQQVDYLNRLAEVFQLDSGHIDNTNASLEDIGIDKSIYYLINLNKQNKQKYANDFAHMVKTSYSTKSIEDHNKEFEYNLEYNPVYLEFLPNQRQLDQIIMVNKELKSPRNKDGHGDAFISNAMALSWLKSNISKFPYA